MVRVFDQGLGTLGELAIFYEIPVVGGRFLKTDSESKHTASTIQ